MVNVVMLSVVAPGKSTGDEIMMNKGLFTRLISERDFAVS
jgi:hypothetical protein